MEDLDILPWLERGYVFGLRDKHVCDLTKIGAGTLSRAKNGSEPLRGQAWLDVKNLILDCEELNRRNPLPPNWTDLRAVRQQLAVLAAERQAPPAPLTKDDWELLGAATPESMTALADKRGISIAELLSTVDAAMRKFDYTINQMQQSSSEMRDLTRLTREEFEARKTSRQ